VLAASAAAASERGDLAAEVDPAPFIDVLFDYLAEHPHLPRLIQRAALDDSRTLRSTLVRLLRPLYTQGVSVLAGSGVTWERAELPHVAAGLYQLIFGYFANARLLEAVIGIEPLAPAAVLRQRRFVRTAVALLLAGGRPTQRRRP
jgi:hypothetical protein